VGEVEQQQKSLTLSGSQVLDISSDGSVNHVPDLNEVNMEDNLDDNEEHMVILGLLAVFQQPNFSHEEVDKADLIDLNAMAEGVEQANILNVEVNLYSAENFEIQPADEPMQ
jgi:hypothetical protein